MDAGRRRQEFWMCAALFLLTFLLYVPTAWNGFVNYDDNKYITENLDVKAGVTWSTFQWAWTTFEQANWHPVTWLSHALDCQLFGLNAAGHHLVSAGLHACNAVLLFLLLAKATGRLWRALLVAGLFAVHPLNVESVAWAAERKSLLCMMFFFLALAAYGWYLRRPSIARYIVIAFCFALGLASKPMIITLPFILLLLDYWPLRRMAGTGSLPFAEVKSFKELIVEKLPLFALSAASAVITLIAQRRGGAMVPLLMLPLHVRVENAIHSYAAYLWMALWPMKLAPFYPGNEPPAWQLGISIVFVVAVSVLVWRERNTRPYLLMGWLWYVGTLMPVIGIIQVGGQGMADRYAYLPLIGIFIAAVWGVADLATTNRMAPVWQAAIAVSVLAFFACLTLRQITYWKSSLDLWSHTLAVTGENFVAEDNMGVTLAALDRPAESLKYFLEAERIKPMDPTARVGVGAEDMRLERWQEAISEYQTAVPMTTDAELLGTEYRALGTAYRMIGERDKSREYYQQALQINPHDSGAFLGMGMLRMDEVIQKLQQTLRDKPTAEGYVQMAQLMQQAMRKPEAKAAYEQAIALGDSSGEAQKALNELNAERK
jgi:protein O-mannosyl-transferase